MGTRRHKKERKRRAEREAPKTTTTKEEAALDAAILFVTESSKLEDRRKIDEATTRSKERPPRQDPKRSTKRWRCQLGQVGGSTTRRRAATTRWHVGLGREHDFLGGTHPTRGHASQGGPRTGAARPALRPQDGKGLDNAAKTDGLADEELQGYGTVLTTDLVL